MQIQRSKQIHAICIIMKIDCRGTEMSRVRCVKLIELFSLAYCMATSRLSKTFMRSVADPRDLYGASQFFGGCARNGHHCVVEASDGLRIFLCGSPLHPLLQSSPPGAGVNKRRNGKAHWGLLVCETRKTHLSNRGRTCIHMRFLWLCYESRALVYCVVRKTVC